MCWIRYRMTGTLHVVYPRSFGNTLTNHVKPHILDTQKSCNLLVSLTLPPHVMSHIWDTHKSSNVPVSKALGILKLFHTK